MGEWIKGSLNQVTEVFMNFLNTHPLKGEGD
jgi:hypothetical protein